MKAVFRLLLPFVILTLLALPALAETITIPGTGSSQLILREVAKIFMKANPGISVEVPDSSGTGGGYKAAGEGTAPLGRVSRKPNEKETGYNLTYLLFGKDPVVVVTHPGVKVKALTWAQGRDLLNGKITSWKEVGGPDLKVRVISRHPTESNFNMVKTIIPEWKGMEFTEKSKLANTDGECTQFVAENEGAIGVITMPDAMEKGLGIPVMGGVKATDAVYPIMVDLALVYKGNLAVGAKKFVDFLFTPEAQGIIRANGAVPVSR